MAPNTSTPFYLSNSLFNPADETLVLVLGEEKARRTTCLLPSTVPEFKGRNVSGVTLAVNENDR
ncbi:hypothetical protein T12_269 [Trichinella patagoniensis]|uniref:Uncharacterized protein n=1 Tax=Trichinella patagoniensis TaxID=990121 RepID=A0A0V0Z9A9_9BILA|nr:hypothetical protein T12_269 [Trichinella patagoniensis]